MMTVSVTCAVSAKTHEVREDDLVPAARAGRFPTLCGETIMAASMAEPDERRCPRCIELLGDDVAARRPVSCGASSGADLPPGRHWFVP